MFDIVIVGGGGAALVAAIEAATLGKSVLVLSKHYPTQSQTSMAQGGINAALYPPDSYDSHIQDTLKAGVGLAKEAIVQEVCRAAPKAIEWLDSIGMPFSRKGEAIAQRRLGGATHPRACYAQDYTGLKLLHTLYDNAVKLGVALRSRTFLLNIIEEDGVCKGVSVLDMARGKVEQILAKAVILATGGYAKMYGALSTNGFGSFGESVAAAMRAGAKLSDLEFVQFHPTALKKSSILISEAARGAGARLIDQEGQEIGGELWTRDRLSRAIFEAMEEGREIFLDMRHLGKEFIEKNLPQERKLALLYEGVDPLKEPVPIRPVAHYTMGGIDVDENMQSSIQGLYAVGECANAKLHGANRLGGNSLLELVVLGKKAAQSAVQMEQAPQQKLFERTKIDVNFIKAVFALPNQIDFWERQEFLSKIMYHNCGIVREEMRLKGVLSVVRQHQKELAFMGVRDKSPLMNKELINFLEYGNMVELAEAVLVGAIQRTESRGAHFRADYPQRDDEKFLAHTMIWKENGVLCADFKPV